MTGGAEDGFTLIELLMGMTLSLVVLCATLTSFANLERGVSGVNALNDSAELARNALDTQARQLRNVAKRVTSPVIDTLQPDNLIFQTADPSRTWVRYCLDTTVAPASPDRGRLWTAELAVANAATPAPVTSSMRGGCPGAGWTQTRVVADYVTNRREGLVRPLFTYTCRTAIACVSAAGTYDEVVFIAVQTFIDTAPNEGPAELEVSSGVHLRNQNQAPLANLVATPSSASRTVVLNASGSGDYEGRTLDYYWFDQIMPAVASIDCARPTVSGTGSPRTLWGAAGYIGDGITLTHLFALTDGLAGTTRNIALVVCDPGDRYGTAGVPPQPAIAIAIPG